MSLPISVKLPADCQDVTDIRQAIDAIDQQVIDLWAERFEYVKAIKFKTDPAAVGPPARLAARLAQRRQWAQAQGLSPDITESICRG